METPVFSSVCNIRSKAKPLKSVRGVGCGPGMKARTMISRLGNGRSQHVQSFLWQTAYSLYGCIIANGSKVIVRVSEWQFRPRFLYVRPQRWRFSHVCIPAVLRLQGYRRLLVSWNRPSAAEKAVIQKLTYLVWLSWCRLFGCTTGHGPRFEECIHLLPGKAPFCPFTLHKRPISCWTAGCE